MLLWKNLVRLCTPWFSALGASFHSDGNPSSSLIAVILHHFRTQGSPALQKKSSEWLPPRSCSRLWLPGPGVVISSPYGPETWTCASTRFAVSLRAETMLLTQSLCPRSVYNSTWPVSACWPPRKLYIKRLSCRACLREGRALWKFRHSNVHWGQSLSASCGKELWNVALKEEGEVAALDPIDHYIFTSRSTITWRSVHLTENALIFENTVMWLLNWHIY